MYIAKILTCRDDLIINTLEFNTLARDSEAWNTDIFPDFQPDPLSRITDEKMEMV